jgi:hypothetical protein
MADRGRDPLTTLAWPPRRKQAGLHASQACSRGDGRTWEGSMPPFNVNSAAEFWRHEVRSKILPVGCQES